MLGIFSFKPLLAVLSIFNAKRDYIRGNTEESLRLWNRAKELDPRLSYNYSFRYDAGVLKNELGISDVDDFIALANVYAGRADLGGGTDLSYPDLQRAVMVYRAHPDSVGNDYVAKVLYCQALLALGCKNFTLGSYGAAERLFGEAVSMEPNNVEALYFLADAQMVSGDLEVSRENFVRVVNLNEAVGISALQYFGNLVYRKPITANAWRSLAWIYHRAGLESTSELCRFNSTQVKSFSTKNLPSLTSWGRI
jgi:tetratricopeptide (TPR) repeat protein